MSVQAIAGVSPTKEASVPGRLIGRVMDRIPVKVCGIKFSYLLFGLLLAPLGALLFFARLLGSRYILTNRSVQIWSSLGSQRTNSVDLAEIETVELDQQAGQAFFRASDIRLKAKNGQTLLRLAGVADAGAFRSNIERAVQARRLVQASLATINARK
jgi:hypothetical protein